jgi:hypothetical protein
VSGLWPFLSALGPIIQSWVALALIFLAVLILCLPRLIGHGLVAACRGAWTLLVPARRARWLEGRREKRGRKRGIGAELELLQREMEEHGVEEARRRQLSRLRAGTFAMDRSHQPTGPVRPGEEPTT